MDEPTCSVVEDGKVCGLPVHVKKYGWCRKHYERWRKHGDPLNPGSRIIGNDAARLRAKVDRNGPLPEKRPELGPCQVWTGAKQGSGYGAFYLDGRWIGAHVAAYTLVKGPVPAGCELDHLCHPGDGSCPRATCRHLLCVNPDHLEAVTRLENIRRSSSIFGANMAKTHCPQGHEYTGENTRVRIARSGNEMRSCRQCDRDRNEQKRSGKKPGWHNAAKTHCPYGHEYTSENTIFDPGAGINGGRRCRTCRRERSKKTDKAA